MPSELRDKVQATGGAERGGDGRAGRLAWPPVPRRANAHGLSDLSERSHARLPY